ncbi:hypothetical protein BH10PSE19_BH10PSE19_07830 [soil metagenome]
MTTVSDPMSSLTHNHETFYEILKALEQEHPLTPEQYSLLLEHAIGLSAHFNSLFKPKKHELKLEQSHVKVKHFEESEHLVSKESFLAHHKPLDPTDISSLEHAVQLQPEGIEIHYTPIEYLELKKQFTEIHVMSFPELVRMFGNQTLTGAPFISGGTPHIEFFIWGNFFGVVKYVEDAAEEAYDANYLVHFQNKQEKTLEENRQIFMHKLIGQVIAGNVRKANVEKQNLPLSPLPTPTPQLLPGRRSGTESSGES